ncbi:MAG TPA: DUF5916 domain-containing protein [Longimicrobiales bacterium]|nr:DUF5916 domain-containing protein [Longimicrobiales bacterium]
MLVIALLGLPLAAAPGSALALELAYAVQATTISIPAATPADELSIARLVGEIRIDGRVDEAAWSSARRVTDFLEFQPGHMSTPSVRTEAFVTYDEEYLYVAIIAHDDPRLVRASLRERDDMFADDWAGVVLDTWGDASWGYLLIANGYGVQGDTRLSNQGDDARFDVVFEADGAVTERGLEVELAIPFSSLRFRGDTGAWRIGFIRNHPRESRRLYSWPAFDSNNSCLLCQFSEMETLAGVRPGGSLELLPSIVASQAGALRDGGDPSSGFANDDPSASLSLGARYPFAGGWNAEVTYNPDFSQVESDAAQVDVNTTFALSFPERRPFFQDGSDLFETPVSVVYTRSINDPEFAGKITGAVGSTSIAYLSAYDETSPIIVPFEEKSAFAQGGGSWSNVLRARHAFGAAGSHVGLLATDRRLSDGGAGTTVGSDLLFRFGGVYSVGGQLVASYTQEPNDPTLTEDVNGETFGDGHTADFDGERFRGSAALLGLSRSTREWSWDLSYRDASPTFRADNGFVARNGYRQANAWTGYTFRPERFGIVEVRPNISGGNAWAWDGTSKDLWLNPGVSATLTAQTNLGVNYVHTFSERFQNLRFEDYGRANFWIDSDFSERLGGGFEVGHGESIARRENPAVLGTGTSAALWATIKPLDRLVIQPEIAYQELNAPDGGELFAGWVARTRFQLQFTRELSLRLVTQYVDFGDAGISVEPLLMYRLNPFSIFYIGSTDRYTEFAEPTGFARTDRQFFLKFQYLFRS